MSKDMLEKLKRLSGGAKVTTADTLGVKAKPVATKPAAPKVAESSWADDVVDDEEPTEEEDGYEIEEVEEDEDSDIPEETHRDPAPVGVTSDEFARKVADLLFAKIRDALNSVP